MHVRAAAAAFLLWHGAAVTLAPYPESDLRRALRPLFEPYLRLAYLDHRWTLFGPLPDAGRLVRYEVIAADESVHGFALSEAIARTNPAWFRWMRLFDRAANGQPAVQQSASAYLCRRHADLRPRAVRFIVLHQLTPSPALYLAGVRPTDPEGLWRDPGAELPCADAAASNGEG